MPGELQVWVAVIGVVAVLWGLLGLVAWSERGRR